MAQFFADDLFKYDAGIEVINPAASAKVLAYFTNKAKLKALHQKRYNMLAYPFATAYQQSNQWVLESMAAAMDANVTSRQSAQAWNKAHGYTPVTLNLSAAQRLGANLTKVNISFDDHPYSLRFSGNIQTVSADSVLNYFEKAGFIQYRCVLSMKPTTDKNQCNLITK